MSSRRDSRRDPFISTLDVHDFVRAPHRFDHKPLRPLPMDRGDELRDDRCL
jgi:hypothetical protein